MPKLDIIEPAINAGPEPSPIPEGHFSPLGAAIHAAAGIGETEMGMARDIASTGEVVGSQLERQGQEFATKAHDMVQEGVYNNAYAQASMEFNQRVQQRMNQPYDANGNPTFGTLSQDIQSIGADVSSKYGNKISDPAYRARFDNSMSSLILNHSVSGLRATREQQIDYSGAALNNNIQANTVNAMSNPQNKQDYFNNGSASIDSAMKNGYITAEEAGKAKEGLRHNIFYGSLDLQNSTDPAGVKNILASSTDQQLNITPDERVQLQAKNQKALESQFKQNIVNRAAETDHGNTQQEMNYNQLISQMGTGKGNDILAQSMYEKGQITHGQYISAVANYNRMQGLSLQKSQTRAEISGAISDGQVLSNFTSAQIDDHYQSRVQALSTPQRPLSLMEKAQIASTYKAPVEAFQKELKDTAAIGSPQQLLQASQAYKLANTSNPLSVSTLDKKTTAALSTLSDMTTYTNIDPAQAAQQVKASILNATPEMEEQRIKQFAKENEFKSSNIGDTINKMYGGYFTKANVDPTMMPMVTNLLKEAYSLTGDAKKAENMVVKETAGVIGSSKFNGDDQVMYGAPEKLYPQFTTQQLRGDLEKSLQGSPIQNKDFLNPNAPRGIRNNNPGNLEKTNGKFGVEVPGTDDRFATYATPEEGIQALGKRLDEDNGKSLNQIISRYAPSSENDTAAYVRDLSTKTGLSPDSPIDMSNKDIKAKLVDGIISIENGKNPFKPEEIMSALNGTKQSFLPTGINSSDTKISSDAVTALRIQSGQAPSYGVYYTGEHGEEVPVLNPNTGLPVRWIPDVQNMQAENAKQLDQLRQQPSHNVNDYVFGRQPAPGVTGVNSPVSPQSNNTPVGQDIQKAQTMSENGEKISTIATSMLGQSEREGAPVIDSFINRQLKSGSVTGTNHIPWCAALVSSVLKDANLPIPKNGFSAAAYLSYGRPTNTPEKGDIVVLRSPAAPSGYHVGFFMGATGDTIHVLSGNTGRAVKLGDFNRNQVASFRSADSFSATTSFLRGK